MLQRSSNILTGLLFGLLSTGLLVLLSSKPRGLPVELLPAPTPMPLRVHVRGAVQQPGVYELPDGSIVEEAIQAAGGTLPEADLEAINLAAPLQDGQQLNVRQAGETPAANSPSPDGRLIAVNSASAAELEQLPGIGPVLAQKIVDHRDANGPFSRPEDLLRVSGIGPSTLDAIRELIVVP